MKHIVVGVDGTPGSFQALSEALEWARMWDAGLETVSVEELPHFSDDIEEIAGAKKAEDGQFHQVVRRVHEEGRRAGIEVRSHIVTGPPVKTLVRFLTEHPCDLLVVGASHHGPLVGVLTHSTCLGLVHEAPCPVLVIRERKRSPS